MSFILILQVHRRLHHLWDLHTHQINEKQNFETVDWFEFLTFVTINLILHLAWFLVLPLVTEKIDCSLKLCCVTIRKMTKICNVIRVSLHSGGRVGHTLVVEMPLSVTGTTYQWFIGLFMKFAVCICFSSVTCLTFLTLIKQFEKVIIKTRQNDMRRLKNIL